MRELVRALWMSLTLDCRKASRLSSDARERDLSRAERWALRSHLAICSACRRVREQLLALGRAARGLARPEDAAPLRLSPEARRRLEERLAAEPDIKEG